MRDSRYRWVIVAAGQVAAVLSWNQHGLAMMAVLAMVAAYLAAYKLITDKEPDATLAGCRLETLMYDGRHFVYIHLPDRTLVYDHAATKELQQPVWSVRTSSTDPLGQYRAQGQLADGSVIQLSSG